MITHVIRRITHMTSHAVSHVIGHFDQSELGGRGAGVGDGSVQARLRLILNDSRF